MRPRLAYRESPFPIQKTPSAFHPQPRFCAAITTTKLTANSCIARCNSKNAVSFSSARTTNRIPSRCASTIQTVRPQSSSAETQPPR